MHLTAEPMSIIIIKFSEIFSDAPLPTSSYLKGIKKSLVVQASAHLAAMLNSQGVPEQEEFICNFFSPENVNFAQRLILRLRYLQGLGHNKVTLTTIPTCLALIEYCSENVEEEDTQTTAESERNLLAAILTLNEKRTKDEMKASNSTKDRTGKHRPAELLFSHFCPTSDLEYCDGKELFFCSVTKAIMLFEFLESQPRLRILFESFLSHYNCRDWKAYMHQIIPIGLSIMSKPNPGSLKLNISNDELFEANIAFLKKFTLALDKVNMTDFTSLRAYPFYQLSGSDFLVIYDAFVLDVIFKGLYFKLNYLSKMMEEENKIDFRPHYTLQFSERCLVYTIMRNIFQEDVILSSGEEMEMQGIMGAPDFYARDGENIFLFESKDILMDAETKASYNYERYEKFLKSRLFEKTKKKGRTANEGVKQLIESVNKVFRKELPDKDYDEKKIHIYPVLVLHDRFWNIAGLNQILNKWFRESIDLTKFSGLDSQQLHPLVVVTTDSLLVYENLFSQRKISLKEVFDEYYKVVEYSNKKVIYESEMESVFMKQHQPFSMFLRNYVIDKGFDNDLPNLLLQKLAPLLTDMQA